jgi:hypothetical protein
MLRVIGADRKKPGQREIVSNIRRNASMKTNDDKQYEIVANARRNQEERESGYREQVIKLYPWICCRCQREFTRANLAELTVHHRDHDHDNNAPDGSNWKNRVSTAFLVTAG